MKHVGENVRRAEYHYWEGVRNRHMRVPKGGLSHLKAQKANDVSLAESLGVASEGMAWAHH